MKRGHREGGEGLNFLSHGSGCVLGGLIHKLAHPHVQKIGQKSKAVTDAVSKPGDTAARTVGSDLAFIISPRSCLLSVQNSSSSKILPSVSIVLRFIECAPAVRVMGAAA